MKKWILINIYFLLICSLFNVVYAQINDNYTENDYMEIVTKVDLLGGEINGISVCRVGETNLGNLIADAVVYSATRELYGTQYSGIPIVGLQNGGGIRKTIHAGIITKEIVKEVLPYGNKMVIYCITPKILYDVLENGVSRVRQGENGIIIGVDGRFPQISGMNFIYDPSQTAMNAHENQYNSGQRILAVSLNGYETILDKKDDKTKIILACNNYCMDGRDGYSMLSSDDVIYTGDTLDNILYEYLSENFSYNSVLINHVSGKRIEIGEKPSNDKEINVIFNGKKMNLSISSLIYNNKIMLPLREIFNELGFDVLWNETERTVLIKNATKEFEFFMNEQEINIDGLRKSTGNKVQILDGYTMISVDILRLMINDSVIWDSMYNTIFIECDWR